MAFEPFDPSGESADLAFSMVVSETPSLGFKAAEDTIVEDEFTRVMKAISAQLNSVTGKVNEPGIRRLALRSRLDVFEEAISAGKRLSIGGSIILIDIEMSPQDGILDVKLSLGSSVRPSEEKHALLSRHASPTADEVLLRALQEVRLTEFARILRHLSRLDRLSSPNIDCFVLVDEVSIALFQLNGTGADPFAPYGLPVKNPKSHLGTGLWYWTKQRHRHGATVAEADRYYAMLSVRELAGPRGVRYATNWLTSAAGPEGPEWSDPEPIPEAKGMFTLELDPPVVTTQELAAKIGASYEFHESEYEDAGSVVAVRRTLHLPRGQAAECRISFAKSVPERLVKISYVPLTHPREIPRILEALRSARLLQSLWHSVTSHPGNQLAEQTDVDSEDYSFADAINEDEERIAENTGTLYMCAYLTQPAAVSSPDALRANLAIVATTGDRAHTISVIDGAKGTLAVSPPNAPLQRALELTEDLPLALRAADDPGAADPRAGTDAMRSAMY